MENSEQGKTAKLKKNILGYTFEEIRDDLWKLVEEYALLVVEARDIDIANQDVQIHHLNELLASKDKEIAELKASKWISVEERLPEIGVEVNVVTEDKRVTSLCRLCRYEGDEKYYWDNAYGGKNWHDQFVVKYWQPLPDTSKLQ